MSINNYIAQQFVNPTGIGGKIITGIMNQQNQILYEETARLLSPRSSDRVLDIGCGNGYVLEMLAKQQTCDYVGIDISKSILHAAAKRNQIFVKNGMMMFQYGEAGKIPFDEAMFDKAYTINTVYFWEDLIGTMAEIKRILKQSGIFINTLYTNDTLARFSHTQFGYKHFMPEQLINAARDVGFDAEIVPIKSGAAYSVVCHMPQF